MINPVINRATISPGNQHAPILPVRKEARKTLRQRLGGLLTGDACSAKLKIMALWAAVWPWSYYLVHKVYSEVSGTAHKYKIQ